MTTLHFEWYEPKAKANIRKHGISFDEAKSVFLDERARLIADPDHSEEEERFILLGLSSGLKASSRMPLLPHKIRCYSNHLGAKSDSAGSNFLLR